MNVNTIAQTYTHDVDIYEYGHLHDVIYTNVYEDGVNVDDCVGKAEGYVDGDDDGTCNGDNETDVCA